MSPQKKVCHDHVNPLLIPSSTLRELVIPVGNSLLEHILRALKVICNRRSNFILQSATKCHRVLRVLFKLSTPPRPSCHASITLSIYLCGYGEEQRKKETEDNFILA